MGWLLVKRVDAGLPECQWMVNYLAMTRVNALPAWKMRVEEERGPVACCSPPAALCEARGWGDFWTDVPEFPLLLTHMGPSLPASSSRGRAGLA